MRQPALNVVAARRGSPWLEVDGVRTGVLCWSMARLVRLDHVQLAMPAGREADAVAFYEGVLGLTEVAKPPVLAARGGCWFADGDLVVHLGVDPAFVAATKAHPAFVVDDLDAIAATLADAGVSFVFDDAVSGVRRGYVADPFGNRIELIDERGPATG